MICFTRKNTPGYVKRFQKDNQATGEGLPKNDANWESNSQEKNANEPQRGISYLIQRLMQLRPLRARLGAHTSTLPMCLNCLIRLSHSKQPYFYSTGRYNEIWNISREFFSFYRLFLMPCDLSLFNSLIEQAADRPQKIGLKMVWWFRAFSFAVASDTCMIIVALWRLRYLRMLPCM